MKPKRTQATTRIELVPVRMPPIRTASSCATGRKANKKPNRRRPQPRLAQPKPEGRKHGGMMMMMEQRQGGATTAKDQDKNAPILLSSSSSSEDGGREERAIKRGKEKEAAAPSPPVPAKKRNSKAGMEEEKKKNKKKKERRSTEGDEEEASKNKKSKKKKNKEDGKDKKMDASCRFPMSRVWRLVRSEGGPATNTRTTPDAVFLINKASEIFLEKFAEDAYATAVRERKKSIAYKHLSSTVSSGKRYEFLSDFVPEMARAEDALRARALVET